MVAHMKTTIEIPDALLKEAKEVAAARGTTLKELVATGLHAVVHDARSPARVSYRRHTVAGNGLQPGVSAGNWETIRSLAYEGVDPLYTVDRDFSRFPALKTHNPLQG